MVDREKVIKGLECCIEKLDTVVNRTHGFNCTACPYYQKCEAINSLVGLPLARDALALLKAQEPQDDDADFMTHIICEICDYAVKNEMEPNDTLLTIADNIKALLKISTFNNWK